MSVNAPTHIVEMDQERDRKTCITLYQKSANSNRDWAKWLLDHPAYSQREVARWVGCSPSNIAYLRKWAANGFNGSPFDANNKKDSRERHDVVAPSDHLSLESLDNSEFDFEDDADDGSKVAAPEVVIDNLLHSIGGMNESARVFNKVLKDSVFDREAVTKINAAIDRMIKKWRSIQSTLEKKG